jgi:hypothetical protein
MEADRLLLHPLVDFSFHSMLAEENKRIEGFMLWLTCGFGENGV